MVLVHSNRLTGDDIAHWAQLERLDGTNARRRAHVLSVNAGKAQAAMQAFGGDYLSCSWGKDSVTVLHLATVAGLRLPVVWVRVNGVENPDCTLVRDAFLSRFECDYHEVAVDYDPTSRRTSARGFAVAAQMFGPRYITGLRGAESGGRAMRMARHGVSSANTCAPIGHWSTADVFAYLHARDVPLHPAYGQTCGGRLDREWLRVGALGGERGRGHGRREWEQAYYPRELREALRVMGRENNQSRFDAGS